MDFDVSRLPEVFRVPADVYSGEIIRNGHINLTYRIFRHKIPVYILQKINTGIFGNLDLLMSNYQLVSLKLSAYQWPVGRRIQVPEIITTSDNKLYFTGENADCWRLLSYIDGIEPDKIPRDENTAYQGGLAFGAFLTAVSDIEPGLLQAVLPDFHSLEKRYDQFVTAMESAPQGRLNSVSKETEFVRSRLDSMMKIPLLMSAGHIPARIVHNDTKLSNVIFDKNGKAAGVIDLDTVMQGSALFDFGDAIRTLANTASEDEPDLSKVSFDLRLFESFSKGYLESSNALLHQTEIDLLPESALLMAYIIGIRFLTDYLNGDVYYQTRYAGHNLTRARVQFRLLALMESERSKMHKLINQIMLNHHYKPGSQI